MPTRSIVRTQAGQEGCSCVAVPCTARRTCRDSQEVGCPQCRQHTEHRRQQRCASHSRHRDAGAVLVDDESQASEGGAHAGHDDVSSTKALSGVTGSQQTGSKGRTGRHTSRQCMHAVVPLPQHFLASHATLPLIAQLACRWLFVGRRAPAGLKACAPGPGSCAWQ